MKKPYASPQIIRVQLNHEQAVLAACSTNATNLYQGTGDECVPPFGKSGSCTSLPNGCRKGKGTKTGGCTENDGASS